MQSELLYEQPASCKTPVKFKFLASLERELLYRNYITLIMAARQHRPLFYDSSLDFLSSIAAQSSRSLGRSSPNFDTFDSDPYL